ncbi:MAG TPA: bifunctional oligoribonuclease/PAP phosphatase NrnA [Haloplasmataceae bacterium]
MRKQIGELIEKYDVIIIHHHINPDCDCIGAQLGLKYMIQASFPNKEVYAVGSHNERTKFLGKLDTIDNDKYQNALVIIVDVGDLERVDDQRILLGKELIKIDHHPKTTTLGNIEWIDTTFSSCCEMIIDLYLNNKDKLTMTNEAARVLYAGILTDTGRYYYSAVLPKTFEYGAEVYKYDFDKQALYADIYYQTLDELRFKGYIYNNFQYTDNGLGYLKITQETYDAIPITPEYAALSVNTLSDIKEIKMWIFFVLYPDTNKIRVEFRSRDIAVNELAKKYGGGGHALASGALVDSWDVVNRIIADADLLCKVN